MNAQSPSMLKPALISGLAFGVASGIPLLGLVNCACCALILACGLLASYLYSLDCRRAGTQFEPANGALIGLLAGVFHTIGASAAWSVRFLVGGVNFEDAVQQLERYPWMEPEAIDLTTRFLEAAGMLMLLAITFVLWLFLSLVFSTLGGLIGGAAFKVERPELSI